ncbi:hypothetical protein BPNPMPFG_007880 (plasmid) [Mesorhizobium sp. AR07]|uniref:hypothetical protein n=1 Tax=Mesorhizobium sp. AR07 TaxID=2865838 RepID=UPI00215E6F51|nr:hypothetical protein [Mesorhizobium sp. AR07]UVK48497.1 hypothetical protein BPNPMPFG_007880 [Mesorhizobium sp. AR07]
MLGAVKAFHTAEDHAMLALGIAFFKVRGTGMGSAWEKVSARSPGGSISNKPTANFCADES